MRLLGKFLLLDHEEVEVRANPLIAKHLVLLLQYF